MHLQPTTRYCQRCLTAALRSDQAKFCSYRCRSGGELRIDYLRRMAAGATKDECVVWPFATNESGYGTMGHDGRTGLVHRISYGLFVGPLVGDECALHSCDNPPCFNPHHLFKGTRLDNNQDRKRKGRGTKGLSVHFCKLTPEQVSDIRSRWIPHVNAGDLAREFGVTTVTIRIIAIGASQPDIGSGPTLGYRKNRKRPDAAGVEDIKRRWVPNSRTRSNHDLAREYDISIATAYRIVTGRS